VVRTAVVPVAGLGTRFLPATKAIPKEMLPIVDRPAIQYIVEEIARSGIDDVLLVTAAGKSAIEDHFDRRLDLEAALEAKGRDAELAEVRALTELVSVHAVRQPEPLGLGHAVLMAAGHVGDDESFAVLLGDDLLEPDSTFLSRMVAAHERTGRAVVALMRVEDPDRLAQYGVVDATPGERDGEVLIHDLVEKPAPGSAPSDLAVIGRYVLPGSIFPVLRATAPGRGGEIQLTDALRTLAPMRRSSGSCSTSRAMTPGRSSGSSPRPSRSPRGVLTSARPGRVARASISTSSRPRGACRRAGGRRMSGFVGRGQDEVTPADQLTPVERTSRRSSRCCPPPSRSSCARRTGSASSSRRPPTCAVTLPSTDNSAMDGYALVADDLDRPPRGPSPSAWP
jgi:UTP--glucose-1-phosphate uridylyltransferase